MQHKYFSSVSLTSSSESNLIFSSSESNLIFSSSSVSVSSIDVSDFLLLFLLVSLVLICRFLFCSSLGCCVSVFCPNNKLFSSLESSSVFFFASATRCFHLICVPV
ncbi:unnamed protein product, partial [Meganyctiphanes norvegica]